MKSLSLSPYPTPYPYPPTVVRGKESQPAADMHAQCFVQTRNKRSAAYELVEPSIFWKKHHRSLNLHSSRCISEEPGGLRFARVTGSPVQPFHRDFSLASLWTNEWRWIIRDMQRKDKRTRLTPPDRRVQGRSFLLEVATANYIFTEHRFPCSKSLLMGRGQVVDLRTWGHAGAAVELDMDMAIVKRRSNDVSLGMRAKNSPHPHGGIWKSRDGIKMLRSPFRFILALQPPSWHLSCDFI
jgi:hypothetical protein